MDLDKGHRLGWSDKFSSRPNSRRLIAISRADQLEKRSDHEPVVGYFAFWAWAGGGLERRPIRF